jgi:chemotaxis protein methyltransferase CheR
MVKIAPHIRKLVTIGRLNLMDPWPFRGPFDVIFCRNVMIYFDQSTRARLVSRMYDLLLPGGILAVGSAETLSGLDSRFRTVQPSVYVK